MTEKRSLLDLPLRDFPARANGSLGAAPSAAFPGPGVRSHNHLGRWHLGTWTVPDVDELLAVMDECHINGIVNLDGGWADELEANLNRYDRAHPGRFASFCRLDWSETKTAGWGERLAASLRDSASRGASGLKLWKDVGLRLRDENGEAIFLDDPRLKPVWDAVAEAEATDHCAYR